MAGGIPTSTGPITPQPGGTTPNSMGGGKNDKLALMLLVHNIYQNSTKMMDMMYYNMHIICIHRDHPIYLFLQEIGVSLVPVQLFRSVKKVLSSHTEHKILSYPQLNL